MAPGKCGTALDQQRPAWPIQGVTTSTTAAPFPHHPLAAICALLAAACGGMQAGGQTGEESEGRCAFQLHPLELDETTALGFTARETLTLALGTREVELDWLAAPDTPYGPENGQARLQVSLVQAGAPKFATLSNGISTGQCGDHVRIPIELSLATDGGALDEHVVVPLRAYARDSASFWLTRDPADLSGSFAFSPGALGEQTFERLEIAGHFDAADFSGLVQAGIEQIFGTSDDGAVSLRVLPLACWGDGFMARESCSPSPPRPLAE
jgi:hypothetical protein